MLGKFLRKKPQLIDRDGERYEVSLRVLSRDLPDYRGVTLDLSRSGVQLETGGILEVGTEPELKFEFDRGELESFTSRARVVWSRQQENSRSKFRSGLIFTPRTDDEKRLLARMAAVLQTRSDTDLKTLLEQARRIDPELERSYAEISQAQAAMPSQGASVAPRPAAPPPAVPAAPVAPPVVGAEKTTDAPPHLGIYIPLSVVIEGYTWNRASRVLHIGLREGDQVNNLFFPECQLFQVLEPAADFPIAALYCAPSSPVARKLQLTESQVDYRHYRFVDKDGKGLIDVVSAACRPTA